MLTNPVLSTILIVVSGFLLSLLSLFVTDPYCRNVQTQRLADAGRNQVQQLVRDIQTKVSVVTTAGKQFTRIEDLTSEDGEVTRSVRDTLNDLLELTGSFTAEISRQEKTPSEDPKRAKARANRARASGKVMQRGKFSTSYRVVAIESNQGDKQEFVGTKRLYQVVRMVYSNDGAMISRPHEFYKGDVKRTGIATTLGPHDAAPIGMLVVTFDELVSPTLLKSDQVSVAATEINLSNQAVRLEAEDYQVIRSDEQTYQAQAKIGKRVFQFVATERPGANFHPHWIKWASFLCCNAVACLIGLSWLQRGRADLVKRNRVLESEVERRIALEKHLQATIDFRDHERELIAHEIHDGFVQDIIGAQMFAESSLSQTEADSPLRSTATAIADLLRNAIDEARKTIDYLKPRVVDEVGLVAALHSAVEHDQKNYAFATDLQCEDDLPRFPILVERMLYRIIREAVSNARQHSGCSNATVSLVADAERIVAEVTDTGVGFDESTVRTDSFGLPGIRQRIEMLNGRMELKTSEFGTKVTVEIPRDLKAPEMTINESLTMKV